MVVTQVLLGVNVCLLLGLAVVGWRNRTTVAARSFAVLQAVSAVWAALTVVGLWLPPGAARLSVWGVTTGTSLVVVTLWFGFILSYTGREDWLTVRRGGVVAAPLIAGGAVYGLAPSWSLLAGETEQATIAAGTVVVSSVGPVGAVLGAYVYAVFLVGLALVVRTVLEGDGLFAGQAIALVLGTLVTVLASAGAIAGVPVDGYPLTQVALGGQSLFWGYAVFRQQFLALVPGVARIGERVVFGELDDGVLVVDSDGTVLRANPRARAFLGHDADGLVGASVDDLLDRMRASSIADLPARFQRQGRTYRATASTVTNWRGDDVGRALVIRDVTDLVERQQRLQVLNRVLRHNVRNDVNVLLGVADRLRQHHDPAVTALGETVARETDGLESISTKVVEIERLFDRTTVVETVDLPALVEDVTTPLADRHPDATVATAVAVDELRTDRWLLSVVLEELVENALLHAGDAPRVNVEATRSGDDVRIAVSDDGPGIPEIEVDTIRSGEETDLQHATGLGLWLVYWGTRTLGGDVEIVTSDEGSTVALSLADRRDGREDGAAAARRPDVA